MSFDNNTKKTSNLTDKQNKGKHELTNFYAKFFFFFCWKNRIGVLICERDNFSLGSIYAQLELVGCFSPKSWPLGVDSWRFPLLLLLLGVVLNLRSQSMRVILYLSDHHHHSNVLSLCCCFNLIYFFFFVFLVHIWCNSLLADSFCFYPSSCIDRMF